MQNSWTIEELAQAMDKLHNSVKENSKMAALVKAASAFN